MKILKALRGAICAANEAGDIDAKTIELFDLLLRENDIAEKDLVSLIFSVTPDLEVQNPASSLRKSGRARETAMMVMQEMKTAEGLPGVIRLLAHVYLDENAAPRHIYRGAARTLRPDLGA
ncbi:MAG: chorismate mutase [Treponema sp.]|nr:chorismate mutase [Treponema sp.]